VAGSCEYGDESSGSGATELVSYQLFHNLKLIFFGLCNEHIKKKILCSRYKATMGTSCIFYNNTTIYKSITVIQGTSLQMG
jgi:hypothetical protein